jgi:hypothetical protein
VLDLFERLVIGPGRVVLFRNCRLLDESLDMKRFNALPMSAKHPHRLPLFVWCARSEANPEASSPRSHVEILIAALLACSVASPSY